MVSIYLSKSFVPVFTVTIIFKSMHCEKEMLQGVTFSLTALSIRYEKLNCFHFGLSVALESIHILSIKKKGPFCYFTSCFSK